MADVGCGEQAATALALLSVAELLLGPAGPDRSSAVLNSAGAAANYTPHHTSAT